MSALQNITFSHNELITIANALELQIDLCNKSIHDPAELLEEKVAAQEALRVSSSALSKINRALKSSR